MTGEKNYLGKFRKSDCLRCDRAFYQHLQMAGSENMNKLCINIEFKPI